MDLREFFHWKIPLRNFVKILCALCGLMKTVILYSWLTLFLIILLSGNTVAQLSQRDRLLEQIPIETNDTVKIELIVRYVMFFAPLPELKKWYDEIHALSLKNNYRPGLIYNRFYEATLLADSGKYDEAISRCKNCIDGLDSLGIIQGLDYPLYNISFFYSLAGKEVEKFQYYSDKQIYYKNIGPVENTATCYHGLGRYYFSLAD